MTYQANRRGFLKTAVFTGIGMGLSAPGSAQLWADELGRGAPNAARLGWRLGCQLWTFHLFSLFEAIEKTASLGLHYIQTGAMKLSKDQPNVVFDDTSPADVRKAAKQKLADSNITLVSFGPTPLSKEITRRTFDFAKDMGVETILCEPAEGKVESLYRLSQEYRMQIAIHNHPKPSHYWNPDTVLKVCRGRSRRIGACADTGHWLRSGLDPLTCLRKLEGRIIELHFKDLSHPGPDAHDVPWGTGVCDVKGMLTEIHRQGIKPIIYVEYEYNWENNLPEIARSIAYFDQIAAELAERN